MEEIHIINNKIVKKINNKFYPTDIEKVFIGDIIKNNKIINSKYRNESIIGYISTSQTHNFGKTKSNKILYELTPFVKNLPKFMITYNGKLKGKIIIKFKFLNWNEQIPRGETIEIIGLMNEKNLIKTLLYHYKIYSSKINYKKKKNELESTIKRINLKNEYIMTIDPKNCTDFDDAISYNEDKNFYYISIHIAQPICWLSKKEIEKTLEKRFATIYVKNNQSNLWGNNITMLSSLIKNKEREAYTIIFKIHKETSRIVETNDFPSLIKVNDNFTYDDRNEKINYLLKITKKWDKKINDTHDLINYWMIKTNNYIGIKIKDSGLPYRVNEVKNSNYLVPKHINEIFKNMNVTSAYYSRDKINHESLNLLYYTHFTSPIRRVIDTVIHYYITYNVKIRINLDKLNLLDKQTKKFNRILNIKYNFELLPDEFNDIGYLYKIIKPNIWLVYTERIGFVKIEIFNINLSYQFEFTQINDTYILKSKDKEYKYKIGDQINITIMKTPGYFPHETYKIILNEK